MKILKPQTILSLATVLSVCVAFVIGAAAAPAPAPSPAPAKPAVSGADEVDIGGVDDSALAAKIPSVKLADGKAAADQPSLDDASGTALVDISCDEATLADIVRQFRKTTGANIIAADSTNLLRRVSVTLMHVPWLHGLQSILASRGFRLEERGGIFVVTEDNQVIPMVTRSFQLNHVDAIELATLFNTSYGEKSKDGKITKEIATAFPAANVVVVTAPEKVIDDCEKILRAVDRAVAQVYIEARFIELTDEAMRKLGVQWDSLESWGATVSGLSGGMEYNNGRMGVYKAGTTSTSVGSTSSSATSASGATSSDTTTKYANLDTYIRPATIGDATKAGLGAADMAWRNARGFSGQLSADDFRLAISAFEKIQGATVFSNPKIIVSNGKEAKVDMTTKFPCVTVTSQRNTSNGSDSLDISTKIEVIPGADKQMFAQEAFFSWGITLSVKPRISPDGLINVEIVPTISQLDSETTKTGFYQVSGGSSSAYSMYPIIAVKRLTTNFTMKDGATAVIGGLSRTEESNVDSGIPGLRKIPWIGQKLFGWTSRQKVQKEIIIFVTVGIANPEALPKDIGLPKNAVLGRQYVNGEKLEPGERDRETVMDLAEEAVATGSLPKKSAKSGTVTITPAQPAAAGTKPAAAKPAAATKIVVGPESKSAPSPVSVKASAAPAKPAPAAPKAAKPAPAKAAQPAPAGSSIYEQMKADNVGELLEESK